MVKKYTGQKKIYGVYHKIINEIPACRKFVELFGGSAQITKLLLEATPPQFAIVNEIDRSVTVNYDFTGHNVTVKNENANYLIVTELSGAGKDTVAYLDPPYHHSTRPTNTELYNYEMTHEHHVQLLSNVLQLKCNVLIIHPKCELYDTMLKDWRKVPVKIRYHRKTSLEYIYMNYERPDALQTDMYLGDDCWDRQRIKRKCKRLIDKLQALPIQERTYILSRLKS